MDIFVKYVLYSISILCISIIGVFISTKRSSFLSGVNGLNMMSLLFLGIGPFCYLFYQIDERPDKIVSGIVIIRLFVEIAPYFIIGYVFSLALQLLIKRLHEKNTGEIDLIHADEKLLNKVKLLFFILSITGYQLAKLEISSSGLGTVFPVLKSFLYPNMVLSIYTLNFRKKESVFLALLICLVGLYFAVTSWWRSELIMAFGAIVSGLLLQSKKAIIPVVILGVVGIMYVLPFQQVKKLDYEKAKENLGGVFVKTLNLTYEERLAFASMFFAERINYGRELAYAQNGINKRYLEYRYGMSYVEIFLQLIPRVVWAEKPSFNTYNNRERARRLGLIGEEDESTAWGVNIYADFILNFSYKWLILFVPLIMLLFRELDKLAYNFSENVVIRFIITSTLFFISFEMVSLLYTSTFILWCFIMAKLMEHSLRVKWQRTFKVR